MAYIAYADGRTQDIDVEELSLDRVKEIVGGWVEPVYPRRSKEYMFLCDEEGLLKGKPVNVVGCELYGTAYNGHPIVGDIIVMTRAEGRKAGWS